jgi:predicted transporter
MLVCVVVGVFLVVTRITTIPNVPAVEDRELIGSELGLGFVFAVAAMVIVTPPDDRTAYATKLQRLASALLILVALLLFIAIAVWFLHYFGPPSVQKQFTF